MEHWENKKVSLYLSEAVDLKSEEQLVPSEGGLKMYVWGDTSQPGLTGPSDIAPGKKKSQSTDQ